MILRPSQRSRNETQFTERYTTHPPPMPPPIPPPDFIPIPPPPPFIPIPPFIPLNDINTEQGSRQHEQQKTWTHPRTPNQEKLSQISQQDYSTHPPPMPPPIPPDFMPPPPPFIPIPPFIPLRNMITHTGTHNSVSYAANIGK